jgi:hypothetical protein
MPRNPAKPALAGPWLRPARLSQSLPTKDSGLTRGMGGAAAFNHAAATPNRAVRMAGRCGVGQTARLYRR